MAWACRAGAGSHIEWVPPSSSLIPQQGASPTHGLAQGRVYYDLLCADCHGNEGEGGWVATRTEAPRIAGADAQRMEATLRTTHPPPFSVAALPDDALRDLAGYVHVELARPPQEPEQPRMGPRALEPAAVGVIAAGAIVLLALLLKLLFAEGRN